VALWACVAILLLATAVGGVGLPSSKSAHPAGPAPRHLHPYAAISAVGIVLYVLAGHLADRFGAGRIYSSGLALIGFGLLLAPFLISALVGLAASLLLARSTSRQSRDASDP
jgi:hypothetical protein